MDNIGIIIVICRRGKAFIIIQIILHVYVKLPPKVAADRTKGKDKCLDSKMSLNNLKQTTLMNWSINILVILLRLMHQFRYQAVCEHLYRGVEPSPFLHSKTVAALQWLISFCLQLCLPLQMHKSQPKHTRKPCAAVALFWLTPAVLTRGTATSQHDSDMNKESFKYGTYAVCAGLKLAFCITLWLAHEDFFHLVSSLFIKMPCHPCHSFPSQCHSTILNSPLSWFQVARANGVRQTMYRLSR